MWKTEEDTGKAVPSSVHKEHRVHNFAMTYFRSWIF